MSVSSKSFISGVFAIALSVAPIANLPGKECDPDVTPYPCSPGPTCQDCIPDCPNGNNTQYCTTYSGDKIVEIHSDCRMTITYTEAISVITRSC